MPLSPRHPPCAPEPVAEMGPCPAPSQPLSLQHKGLKLCSSAARRWLKRHLCPQAPRRGRCEDGNKAWRGGSPRWGLQSAPEPLPSVGRGTQPPPQHAGGAEHPARTQLPIPQPHSGRGAAGRNLERGEQLPSGVCCARASVEAQLLFRQLARNTSAQREVPARPGLAGEPLPRRLRGARPCHHAPGPRQPRGTCSQPPGWTTGSLQQADGNSPSASGGCQSRSRDRAPAAARQGFPGRFLSPPPNPTVPSGKGGKREQ